MKVVWDIQKVLREKLQSFRKHHERLRGYSKRAKMKSKTCKLFTWDCLEKTIHWHEHRRWWVRAEASKESRDDNSDDDTRLRRPNPENLLTEMMPVLEINVAITRLCVVSDFVREKPIYDLSTTFQKMQCIRIAYLHWMEFSAGVQISSW